MIWRSAASSSAGLLLLRVAGSSASLFGISALKGRDGPDHTEQVDFVDGPFYRFGAPLRTALPCGFRMSVPDDLGGDEMAEFIGSLVAVSTFDLHQGSSPTSGPICSFREVAWYPEPALTGQRFLRGRGP